MEACSPASEGLHANTIASGTYTVLSNDGSTVRLRIEADDPIEAARNGVHGEVAATFCE